jgi:hypothetical protein
MYRVLHQQRSEALACMQQGAMASKCAKIMHGNDNCRVRRIMGLMALMLWLALVI